MTEETLKLYLQGGLGNQIFQIAAGRYIAEKFNKRLVLVGEFRNLTGTFRKETILTVVDEIEISGGPSWVRKILFRVVRRFALTNKLFSSIVLKLTGHFFSSEVGYDPKAEMVNAKGICGYFQTSRYLSHFPRAESFRNFLSRDEEILYTNLVDEILKKNPIGIHIRRGDYLNETDGIGLLSDLYFQEVVESLATNNRECWIVTDSPECIDGLSSRLNSQTRILRELNDLPAHISLMVLSMFQELVISNSSFSLAAAMMSTNCKLVHFPDPWFRDLPVPTLETPGTWIAHKSYWVS